MNKKALVEKSKTVAYLLLMFAAKVFITIAILAFFAATALVGSVYYSMEIVSNEVNHQYEYLMDDFEDRADRIVEGVYCEFDYQGMHYRGPCSDEIVDGMTEYVQSQFAKEVFYKCMSLPYWNQISTCVELFNGTANW